MSWQIWMTRVQIEPGLIDLSEYESETEKDKPSDNIIDEEHYIYVQNPIGHPFIWMVSFLVYLRNFRKVIGTYYDRN